MAEPASTNSQAERTASLSRAAESLAKAATKLSEAARAMSMVAEALSKGNIAKKSGINGSEGKPLQSGQPEPVPSSEAVPAEDEGAGLPQPHRILLDDEADILLMLCSLIYDRPKVVCYFTCGASSLKLYKSLIDGVAETNAMVADPSEGMTIDLCYDKFLKEKRSLILLSETDIPSVSAKEVADYSVIHVGWPAEKRRYVAQRRAHHASNNLLLAFSGDKDLYLAGSAIMSQTETWPGDSPGFRASVDILRPLFEERLSEVPFEVKEEVYLDWIHSHSQQGSRFVSSWTPSTLVSRANKFILGPLAYRSPGSLARGSTLQAPLVDLLPEVPMEFVTQHGLQAAVGEGLLRVETEVEGGDTEIHEPGSNSASRWSAANAGTEVLFNHIPSYQHASEIDHIDTRKDYAPHLHGVNASPVASGNPMNFELITGQTYFALEEEFDSIPLIYFLTRRFKKTIIFLEGTMLKKYTNLFRALMRQQVIMIKPGDVSPLAEEVSFRFVQSASPVVLLIEHTINELPNVLKQYSIGCWVYWVHDLQISIAKRLQAQLTSTMVALVIPSLRRDRLFVGISGFKEHPQASLILSRNNPSLLEPERNATRVILSEGRWIQGLYTTRIASLRGGSHQGTRNALEAVQLANQYAARVLLHGTPEDGSRVYPPVAGRPGVTQDILPKGRINETGLDYFNHQVKALWLRMPSESGRNTSADSIQTSLASLANAADILAQVATSLAAAAQATVEALSKETTRPESPEESYGINLGRGSDAGLEIVNSGDEDQRPTGEERPMSVTGDAEDQTDLHSVNTDIPEPPGNSHQNDSSYRLLVDSETDVLLFVCALIDKRHKTICYMPCGNVPLKAYKLLIESVTESPVHMLSTTSKWDLGYTDFLKSHGSVLLVPETLLPQLEMDENSWVIHVGWPASEERCSNIMRQTQPWPLDNASFRASVSILRPLYEIILSEISLEMKAQVYLDWIQLHGIHGSRRVEMWSPSVLVQHANDYILKVWQWSGEHTGGDDIPLPEVSRGFVTQNSLQQPVLEELLRVEDDDSPSPVPSPSPRPDSVLAQTEFQPTTGNTCFILHEEFDALPLMCFISEKYGKVILFLEGQAALRYYQKLSKSPDA
ncbi:Lysosomal-trafficking regulator [Rhizoctonia solani]|uniref:Lysosomal-trafficking regulator n=1 Tax=Rhizoctonia solani TaxID=456999 RepID=A0A0K6FYN4_9AGAM|nr:Lysosomal-trafficking regulator [Rhizoctonia solani]